MFIHCVEQNVAMGAINSSDVCDLIQNLIKKHLFSKNDYLPEYIKMVITPLVINIFP